MKFSARGTFFFLTTTYLLFLYASADSGPLVHTRLGLLKGKHVSAKGKETRVHAYLGVPFAKPPVGPLRLAPPQPAERWEGERDATHQPPICIQSREHLLALIDKIGGLIVDIPDVSEDCLYLNIYTPANTAQDAKLPVMVWIHGGGLAFGSASIYDGSALAAYQDVVVVVIQYRLGLLGFLSTGDEHISGNFGLLDQVEALRWVQQHIHNFGGDAGSVTIFGESAGGVSVSVLLLSPLSDGLFHRAIAESGTAAIEALVTNNPLPFAQLAANASGCDLTSTETITVCMKHLDHDAIMTLVQNPMLRFPSCVDGHFLTKPVDELFQNKELLKIPFITGVNNDEGGWLLPGFLAPPNWTEGIDWKQVMTAVSVFLPDPEHELIRELLLDEYLRAPGDRGKNRDGLTELIGDLIFTIPAIRTANAHRDAGAPVYLYEYQHAPEFLQKRRPSFVKSDHGDDIFAVLGFCFTSSDVILEDVCTEKDKQLSKTMMNYWGNFARTGSPNGDGLVHWPQYGAAGDYLMIGVEQAPGQHLKKDRFTFFTQTLPEMIKKHQEKMELLKNKFVVHTKLGGVRGQYVSVRGKETGVRAYLGVPFAKPPIGPLRLAPPQPAERWEGVRDATQQPPICIQYSEILKDVIGQFWSMTVDIPDVSEDCLYLNIYVPANTAQDAKLPVMVWIHGGGLTSGSASIYDGSALAAYQDVVVVGIQYRLGLLGFLSTGDEHASGNFGLLDQLEALRWVQQHIHNFGGDAGSVTIFGESAGGASVSLLLLSPLSDGLFHRAIAESGTAAMEALVTNDPLPFSQVAANASGCDLTSAKTIADCIKQMDHDAIMTLVQNPMLIFPASIDGHVLTKPVDELYKNKELHKIPFITGVNNDEGGWLLPSFFAPPNWTEGMDWKQVLTTVAGFLPDPKQELMRKLITDEYLRAPGDRVKNRDGLTELIGDVLFAIPAIKTANAHRDAGAPVYLYEYQHAPELLQKKRPSFVKSDHGDEIFAVLGFCFTTRHVKYGACTEKDKQLSKTMMNYWGNFARTGSPNGDGLVHWPQYGAAGDYLSIGLEQAPGQHLKKDRFTFFTQTLPETIKKHQEKIELLKNKFVVHTKLGGVRGQYVSVRGKETGVRAYRGVPFAKPPIGPLRLAPPQPAERWEGVRDATQQPPMCIQSKEFLLYIAEKLGGMTIDLPDVSEDCLYLNIYVPANAAQDAKLPVMVWIHGGGLTSGSASIYDGSALAAYQDVVVVVIQYRLGLLGFLSTGDEHISGNFGLLDQVEALRWVQQHIHNFGGDAGSVTIFGESAGGASVSLLLLSPLSDGLFHRAIAESGTAAMHALVITNPLSFAQVAANASGCDLTSTETIAVCMKHLDHDAIMTLVQNPALRFPSCVDGHVLTKPVDELYQSKELLKIPFITGVNNDEGGWLLPGFLAPPNWTEGMDREQALSIVALFFPGPNQELITELIADKYLGAPEDRVKNRDGFIELIGDLLFIIPAIKTANAHRDAGAPMYLYEYQHAPQFLQKKRPSFVKADHGDDIFAVFGLCFTTTDVKLVDVCTEEDKQLCKTMMNYWGNFARTGSPNGGGLVHWPQYGAEGDYLIIGVEQAPGQHLKKDRFTFFTETLPEKIKQHEEKMEHSEL